MATPATSRSVTRPARSKGGRRGVILAALLLSLVIAGCSGKTGYQYRWDYFVTSIFQPDGLIFRGVVLTLFISVIAQTIGVVLGVLGAVGKMAHSRFPRYVASVYVWIFRERAPGPDRADLLRTRRHRRLQVARLRAARRLRVRGRAGRHRRPRDQRGRVHARDHPRRHPLDRPGQMEAAKSLGMPYGLAMRRIILPQAARVIIPPLGNEFNGMLKTTSLSGVIGVQELFATRRRATRRPSSLRALPRGRAGTSC